MKQHTIKQTTKSMKNFWVIFSGQFVSTLGSSISSFGLSIWVLMQTSSATLFSLTYFATVLPFVLLSPITGSVADRKNRKYIIVICDTLDAILKLMIITLFFIGKFEIWMIIVFNFLSSTLNAFQSPAFQASIPVLVPKEELSKANSMLMLIQATKMLLAPIIAGFLYPIIDLLGLFIIDFATYSFAILTILPQNLHHQIKKTTKKSFYKTVKSDFKETMIYLKKMGVFFKIILTVSALNFIASFIVPLLGPLVTANYNAQIYGIVQASFAIAMIIGSIITNMIPSNNKIRSIYICIAIDGIAFIVMGISYKWYIIVLGITIMGLLGPRTNGFFGAIMQSKISNDMLGKVSSVVTAIGNMFTPIAVLFSGALADYVFKPLLTENGALANTIIGTILGVGKARGIGLMFVIAGIITSIMGLICLLDKKIISFEKDYPDVVE